MKIITKNIEIKTPYPLAKIGDPEKLLFFDIETTGLSAASSALYLIGTLNLESREEEKEKEVWKLCQFFAEDLFEELFVLKAFLSYAENFDYLLSFNGEGFDLPFLKKICAQYRLAFLPEKMRSLDIYKSIRKYRALIRSPRMNQKSLEIFLGIERQDPYQGRELIELYEKYLEEGRKEKEEGREKGGRTKEEARAHEELTQHKTALLHAILLHNEEDLSSLPLLLSLLSFKDFLSCTFSFCGARREEERIILHYRSPIELPRDFSLQKEEFLLRSEKNLLIWESRLYSGSAKHYFDNYKDYYFLPAEDYAIHKSIGIFVSSSHRIPAKKENAYIKKSSVYLPLPKERDDDIKAPKPELFYLESLQGRPYMELRHFLSAPEEFKEGCLRSLLKELI